MGRKSGRRILRGGSAIAVILAAGESRRMGMTKAMLEYSPDKTFLAQLAHVFESVGCRVMAVIGHNSEAVGGCHPGVELVENLQWREGQFSSARFGIKEALGRNAQWVLIHPVDVPSIRAQTVRSLLEAAHSGSDPIVPKYQGASGHPLVLSQKVAEAILEAPGSNLESVLQTFTLNHLSVDDPGIHLNINTPADYQRLLGHAPRMLTVHKGSPSSSDS